jgi:nucleotide-binding universal stress UspA family protein
MMVLGHQNKSGMGELILPGVAQYFIRTSARLLFIVPVPERQEYEEPE